MRPMLKLTLKFLISWFLLVLVMVLAHTALRQDLSKILWGLGTLLFVFITLAGFFATCIWVVSRFRLFDDTYWY
jgi:hypothetical protein